MRISMTHALLVTALMLLLPALLPADPASDALRASFDSACVACDQGRFHEAAGRFEGLLAQGWVGPDIEYNLGIAYFRMGQTGRSILHLERSRAADPGSQDVIHNLEVARSRVRDDFQPLPVVFLVRWWLDIKDGHTPAGILWFVALFLSLTAAAVFALVAVHHVLVKRIGLVLFLVGITLSGIFITLYFDKVEDVQARRTAVVLVPETDIRKTPDAGGERMSLIHEGSMVDILQSQGEWVEVRLIDGRTGWMSMTALERI